MNPFSHNKFPYNMHNCATENYSLCYLKYDDDDKWHTAMANEYTEIRSCFSDTHFFLSFLSYSMAFVHSAQKIR